MLVRIEPAPELVRDRPLAVAVGDRRLLLIATATGLYAIDDSCPHQGLPLGDGTVTDDLLTCRHHGVRIALATGAIVDSRGFLLEPIDIYPVTRDGRALLIELS